MHRTYTIPARFHPARSLLGRWISRLTSDPRSGETTYFVAAVTLGVLLVVMQYLAWAYMYPLSAAAETTFLLAQIALLSVYAGIAIVGRAPAYRIIVDADGLTIHQGDDAVSLLFTDIQRIAVISAQTYHAHYARYARTLAAVNRIHPTLLLLEVRGDPVALGVKPEEVLELEALILERTSSMQAANHMEAS